MESSYFFTLAGLALTAFGAVLLYLASEHQKLLRQQPPTALTLSSGALAMLSGIGCWVADWGGLVGGLLALAVWMGVSVLLPFLLARRSL